MQSEVTYLPVRLQPMAGEALDSFAERVATHNGLSNAQLTASLRALGGTTAYAAISPTTGLIRSFEEMNGLAPGRLDRAVLSGLAGLDFSGFDPSDSAAWRTVASRGWAPARGSALCPHCLRQLEAWNIAWRHPWITSCPVHRTWLVATCATCGMRFRSQRTALRSVDAGPGTCANPAGKRGAACPQRLTDLPTIDLPAELHESADRIWMAAHGGVVASLGCDVMADRYLADIKALTVLILHLASQEGSSGSAPWAAQARKDSQRSAGSRGARWGLAPPASLQLRGHAIAAADHILRAPDLNAAAGELHFWTELTPPSAEGRLGWIADHTKLTPTASRLVISATSRQRRLSTLLAAQRQISAKVVPQVVPSDRYARHLARHLEVTDPTGRCFASLCLIKLGRPGTTWSDAAAALGLTEQVGRDTARACSANVLCGPGTFAAALSELANEVSTHGIDYRSRELAVESWHRSRRWYREWAKRYRPGGHATSERYAVALLWTAYAAGHLRTSPGWTDPPTRSDLAQFRRWARNLQPESRTALMAAVERRRGATPTGTGGAAHRLAPLQPAKTATSQGEAT